MRGSKLQPVSILGCRSDLGRALPESWKAAYALTQLSSDDCDLRSTNAVEILSTQLQKGSVILFFATINRHRSHDKASFDDNLSMAKTVSDTAIKTNAKGVIFTSAVDIYGSSPSLPINETTKPAPESWYAKSKWESEQLLLKSLERVCNVGIFRCPGLYNPEARGNGAIASLTQQARAGSFINLNNNGENLRDFVNMNDLYLLFSNWINQPRTGVWNVASSHSISMNQVARHIIQKIGSGSIRLSGNDNRNFNLTFENTKLRETFPDVRIRNFLEAYSPTI